MRRKGKTKRASWEEENVEENKRGRCVRGKEKKKNRSRFKAKKGLKLKTLHAFVGTKRHWVAVPFGYCAVSNDTDTCWVLWHRGSKRDPCMYRSVPIGTERYFKPCLIIVHFLGSWWYPIVFKCPQKVARDKVERCKIVLWPVLWSIGWLYGPCRQSWTIFNKALPLDLIINVFIGFKVISLLITGGLACITSVVLFM